MSDEQVENWNKLTTSLHLAGEKIENVLIKDLGNLAPVIAALSNSMADAIVKISGKITATTKSTIDYIGGINSTIDEKLNLVGNLWSGVTVIDSSLSSIILITSVSFLVIPAHVILPGTIKPLSGLIEYDQS